MPERIEALLEIGFIGQQVHVRGVWEKKSEGLWHFLLTGLKNDFPIDVNEVSMHVIAIEVDSSGDAQEGVTKETDDMLSQLWQLSPNDKPLQTCMIDGRECVVFMLPYTR